MNKYLAEFIGTFALVFCGTGAIVINQISGGAITHPGVAATFGLIIMVMIYSLGPVSGAHFNPAVTLAFTFAGRFKRSLIIPYLISQVAGAFLASYTLLLLFPTGTMLGTTLPSGTGFQSFILELLLTFFLMLVILKVSSGSKEQGMFAGLAIGGTVLLEALFAGPVCGASMNPARSLSPAVVSGNLQSLWVYLVAPTLGAALAVPAARVLKNSDNGK
jgi:aquaporin Z